MGWWKKDHPSQIGGSLPRRGQGASSRQCQQLAWKYIQNANWRSLRTMLRDPEVELLHQKQRRPQQCTTTNARLPMLSYSIWNGAPLVIIELFLERYPAAIYDCDSMGRLPLHIACFCGRSPPIVDLLLELVPNSRSFAMVTDICGNVPLHYAVDGVLTTSSSSSSDHEEQQIDIVTSLVSSCPQAAVVANQQGETAVMIAQRIPDQKTRKAVCNMLVRTQKTLSSQKLFVPPAQQSKKCSWEDFTVPSSSHFLSEQGSSLMLLQESAVFTKEDSSETEEWEGGQAVGERPQRRNGMVVVSTVGCSR